MLGRVRFLSLALVGGVAAAAGLARPARAAIVETVVLQVTYRDGASPDAVRAAIVKAAAAVPGVASAVLP